MFNNASLRRFRMFYRDIGVTRVQISNKAITGNLCLFLFIGSHRPLLCPVYVANPGSPMTFILCSGNRTLYMFYTQTTCFALDVFPYDVLGDQNNMGFVVLGVSNKVIPKPV